jgi:tetratricopeptide (TPR) repeat protein
LTKSIKTLLADALAVHQAGNLAKAGELYRAVLAIQESQFDALHMMGVLEAQLGNFDAGERLLARAAAAAPGQPAVHLNRGAVLERLRRFEEAVRSYDKAIAIQPGYLQAHFNRGNALDALGRPAEALASYDRTLAINPNLAEAHYNRGSVLQALKRPDEALVSYGKAIEINPNYAEALGSQGNLLRDLERFDEALVSYAKASAIAPDYAPIHLSRGVALHRLKRWPEAVVSYDRAIAIDPQYAEAYTNRGSALHELGRLEDALANYDRALALTPASAAAHVNRSATLLQLNRHEEALASADRAIAIDPQNAEAHCNCGSALRELGRVPDALASYDTALALAPDFADAHAHRGVALLQLKQYEAAFKSYDRALEIDPSSAESLAGRGRALKGLGRTAEALESFDQALLLNPKSKFCLSDRAGVLQELRRFDDALADYESAVAVDPDFANAHYDLATLSLRRGDFERGFREYEWRWKVANLKFFTGSFTGQPWLGREDISGKTIVLFADQGLGDTIQFCRYAKLATAAGARVILQVQKPLVALLSNMPDVERVIAAGDPLPEYDLHAPLSSLPLAFGTTLASMPAEAPYLLAPRDRLEHWRTRLATSGGLRVGLNWAGNPSYAGDAERSIFLPRLLPLLANEQANFFGLQSGLRDGDADILRANPDINYVGDLITPFEDAAAVVALMDVVISVDTAMGHLAAALGRPVWILLPFLSDWRWLLDRADSPWYPTARLFRQARAGDWDSVVSELSRELSRGLAGGGVANP